MMRVELKNHEYALETALRRRVCCFSQLIHEGGSIPCITRLGSLYGCIYKYNSFLRPIHKFIFHIIHQLSMPSFRGFSASLNLMIGACCYHRLQPYSISYVKPPVLDLLPSLGPGTQPSIQGSEPACTQRRRCNLPVGRPRGGGGKSRFRFPVSAKVHIVPRRFQGPAWARNGFVESTAPFARPVSPLLMKHSSCFGLAESLR